jgi:hypothetical protein
MDDQQMLPTSDAKRPRVALMWRGDPAAPARPDESRQRPIFEGLRDLGAEPEAVAWDESAADAVRGRLAACDGVLVWVDPLSEGRTRAVLDPLLREVAAAGTWVSTHPDVTAKMGVKAVLWRTRSLGWDAGSAIAENADAFRAEFPGRLAEGPRVVKRNRGNGGQGIWKVEAVGGGAVEVLEARRGAQIERMPLGAFLARCDGLFETGPVVDQAFQPRLAEGMTRCYLSGGEVVGYGHQLIKALLPPGSGEPGPRIMHPPEAAAFQALRRKLEDQWVPGLQRLLNITDAELPALWDADFLLGAKTPAGDDSYALCEINVSSVAPFPDTAALPVARRAFARAMEAMRRRQNA